VPYPSRHGHCRFQQTWHRRFARRSRRVHQLSLDLRATLREVRLLTLLPSKLVAVALAALTVLVACANDATEPSRAEGKPDADTASDNPRPQGDGGRDASATGSADSGRHDGGSASSDRLDGDVPTIDVEVTVGENPQNPLSVFVEWQTSSEGTTFVRVECDEDFGYEVVGLGKRRQHRAYLQGFWE